MLYITCDVVLQMGVISRQFLISYMYSQEQNNITSSLGPDYALSDIFQVPPYRDTSPNMTNTFFVGEHTTGESLHDARRWNGFSDTASVLETSSPNDEPKSQDIFFSDGMPVQWLNRQESLYFFQPLDVIPHHDPLPLHDQSRPVANGRLCNSIRNSVTNETSRMVNLLTGIRHSLQHDRSEPQSQRPENIALYVRVKSFIRSILNVLTPRLHQADDVGMAKGEFFLSASMLAQEDAVSSSAFGAAGSVQTTIMFLRASFLWATSVSLIFGCGVLFSVLIRQILL